MKIAIPTDNQKTISSHFGRTKGFLIFEVEGKEVKREEFRINTFSGHREKGKEVEKHKGIIETIKDCKIIIAHNMGMRIYNDLKDAGLEIFLTDEIDIKKALDSYLQEKLTTRPEPKCCHKEE